MANEYTLYMLLRRALNTSEKLMISSLQHLFEVIRDGDAMACIKKVPAYHAGWQEVIQLN